MRIDFDPRTKIILVMSLTSLAVFINDPFWLAGLLMAALFLSYYFRSRLVKVLVKFKKFIGVFIGMIFIQSIFQSGGESLLTIHGFSLITTVGLLQGVSILFRMLIIIVSATILGTSNSRDIVQGLYQWKIPYELAFMVSVAIRFLPLLKEEAVDIYTAIQLRGLNIKELSFKNKIKVYSYLIMPLISGVINKARELAISVEMRGFRASPTRTNYRSLALKKSDYILMTLSLLLTAALLFIYINNLSL